MDDPQEEKGKLPNEEMLTTHVVTGESSGLGEITPPVSGDHGSGKLQVIPERIVHAVRAEDAKRQRGNELPAGTDQLQVIDADIVNRVREEDARRQRILADLQSDDPGKMQAISPEKRQAVIAAADAELAKQHGEPGGLSGWLRKFLSGRFGRNDQVR